jgi:hypothetical protein
LYDLSIYKDKRIISPARSALCPSTLQLSPASLALLLSFLLFYRRIEEAQEEEKVWAAAAG